MQIKTSKLKLWNTKNKDGKKMCAANLLFPYQVTNKIRVVMVWNNMKWLLTYEIDPKYH